VGTVLRHFFLLVPAVIDGGRNLPDWAIFAGLIRAVSRAAVGTAGAAAGTAPVSGALTTVSENLCPCVIRMHGACPFYQKEGRLS